MSKDMTIYGRYRFGEERLAAGDPLAAARALEPAVEEETASAALWLLLARAYFASARLLRPFSRAGETELPTPDLSSQAPVELVKEAPSSEGCSHVNAKSTDPGHGGQDGCWRGRTTSVSKGFVDEADPRGQDGCDYGSEGWGFESLRAREQRCRSEAVSASRLGVHRDGVSKTCQNGDVQGDPGRRQLGTLLTRLVSRAVGTVRWPALWLALTPWFILAGIAIGCVETAEHDAVAAYAPGEIRGSSFGLLAAVQGFGIFSFGGVGFHGSLGANPPSSPVVSAALLP
jgi:hypothetical protein